ncbi:MAG: oligopeptide transporter, OPT family, partial [candidate division Zixibacteria bacterium]|nr:oligopeptide transporter, OPT family [candidate division Zixibacteria bacterium]
FMIPLRRHLIVKEHKVLPYPEGTACAEILEAGDEGGAKAKTVFTGLGIGALYKMLMSGFKLWPERFELTPRFFPGSQMGVETTPALMGVGFIIGPKIALLLFSGAVLGYVGIGPLMAYIGKFMTAPLPPAAVPISELSAGAIRDNYIKYIGIGAVAMGGFVSLMRFLPTIISSFKHVTAGLGQAATVKIRTDEDLPTKLVWGGAFLIALAIWLLPKTEISLLGALLAVLFGFFFVTVSSRMVGIVGSSSLPISGMTIGTLIVVSVILLSSGVSGTVGMVASMMVGSVVCIAVSMAGDASQDLKTGFLVGATPRRQQLAEFLGVLIPALVMGWVIMFLNKTYGFTGPTALEAPQANAMAAVVQGVMTGVLPWAFIITGLILGLSIELLGIHALPVAIGLYLPPELSTPIVVGSLVFWWVNRFSGADARSARTEKGILFGSGMVAGDALVGVALSILVGTIVSYAAYFTGADKTSGWFGGTFGNFFTLVLFLALGLGYLAYVWRVKK